jgi:hypothetical protein
MKVGGTEMGYTIFYINEGGWDRDEVNDFLHPLENM